MEEIQQTRIRCARKDSSVYPARLKELPGMPKQLYYIGSFPDDVVLTVFYLRDERSVQSLRTDTGI